MTDPAPTLRVYNSLTRRKEAFQPLQAGKVGLYGCGVTVYGPCHLGHAMQAIVFDVIVRYLRFRGFQVTYVRNHTDVDDKVIARARELDVLPLHLSAEMIAAEERDMAALGVLPPTHAPKVSDFIPQIVEFVQRLIERGHAYVTEKGNAYYRVRSKSDYGKLSGRRIDELAVGTRKGVEDDKEDPLDFALWKAEEAEGAWWDSPFGRGRPGWHIECSVMSHELLGDPFDIHGGGLDLIFPHHENEIAQSEGYCGAQHVRYWVHNGLLTVNKQKMSKSLGNFFTVEAALQRFGAELIRFTLLQYHYRSDPDFDARMMAAHAGRLYAAYEQFSALEQKIADAAGEGLRVDAGLDGVAESVATDVRLRVELLEREFVGAMDDDFGAPRAIVALTDGLRFADECLRRKKTSPEDRLRTSRAVVKSVRELAAVLGILQRDPATYLRGVKDRFLAHEGVEESWIDERIAARATARTGRDWAAADALRDELAARGIELRDRPAATDWAVARDALERLYGG